MSRPHARQPRPLPARLAARPPPAAALTGRLGCCRTWRRRGAAGTGTFDRPGSWWAAPAARSAACAAWAVGWSPVVVVAGARRPAAPAARRRAAAGCATCVLVACGAGRASAPAAPPTPHADGRPRPRRSHPHEVPRRPAAAATACSAGGAAAPRRGRAAGRAVHVVRPATRSGTSPRPTCAAGRRPRRGRRPLARGSTRSTAPSSAPTPT